MDDRVTVVAAVTQQCGACGHAHSLQGGVLNPDENTVRRMVVTVPACELCGCNDYRLHADELAALDAAETAEAGMWARPPLLPPDVAAGIRSTLLGYEAEHRQWVGWDGPPVFGVIMGVLERGRQRPPGLPDNLDMFGLVVKPLRIPQAFYTVGAGDPARTMLVAAQAFEQHAELFDRFRRSAGHDPGVPVLGWYALTELVAQLPDGSTGPGVRELVFADIDERIYSVVRSRTGDEQVRSICSPLPRYRVGIADMIAGGLLVAGPSGDLPIMTEALLRLARLGRAETELRAVFGDQPNTPGTL